MLRIRNWEEHYETNRTRRCQNMVWVPVPTKMDGDGFTELVDHADGAAHYGAWIACLLVASKCSPRGTLARDDGRPHDAASLARITRLSREVFEAVIPRLIAIGWLEEIDGAPAAHQSAPAAHPGCSADATEPHDSEPAVRDCAPAVRTSAPPAHQPCAAAHRPCADVTLQYSTEQYSTETEQDTTEHTPIAPKGAIAEAFEHWWGIYPKKSGKRQARRNFDKALRALKTGPPKRTTAEAADILLVAVRAYALSPKAQSEWCWNPATWLSGGHWEDDPAVWQRGDRPNEPSGPVLWGDD